MECHILPRHPLGYLLGIRRRSTLIVVVPVLSYIAVSGLSLFMLALSVGYLEIIFGEVVLMFVIFSLLSISRRYTHIRRSYSETKPLQWNDNVE